MESEKLTPSESSFDSWFREVLFQIAARVNLLEGVTKFKVTLPQHGVKVSGSRYLSHSMRFDITLLDETGDIFHAMEGKND